MNKHQLRRWSPFGHLLNLGGASVQQHHIAANNKVRVRMAEYASGQV
jgi:hypothetical protein